MSLRDSSLARAYYRVVESLLLAPLMRVFKHPDQITIAGALVSALTPLGFYLHPAAGLAVLLASGLADSLDGPMARKMGLASRYGAFLDSSLDRVSDFLYLAGFWVLFRDLPEFFWASLLTMAAVTATLMISYTKARAEGLGGSCKAGLMSRAPRVIYLLAWAVLLVVLPAYREAVLWWGLSVYTTLAVFTVAQRIVHVQKKGLAG
jgi:CDP-diacylglycerol--glycerol-3-phosphate 3-phosphatidyltransferase